MKKEKLFIIPVFLPWAGCKSRCIYCNETALTGLECFKPDDYNEEALDRQVESYLSYSKDPKTVQIAFFGGTFSNLEKEIQTRYLKWATKWITKGSVDSIRLSTGPVGLDNETLQLYKATKCRSIEIGVQSFDDDVLKHNNRAHDAKAAESAVRKLIDHGFEVGIHLMTGLYRSNDTGDLDSLKRAVALKPDTIRVHPTLVLTNTPLETLYRNGGYTPLTLREAVEQMGVMKRFVESRGIRLNRVGLFIPSGLEKNIVAGPYTPSFGDMVKTMELVYSIKDQIEEAGQVVITKPQQDRLKGYRGFFQPYLTPLYEKKQIAIRECVKK